MQLNVGIITVSDRASKGLYDDLGGPALQEAAAGYGWNVIESVLVPDEIRDIQRAIRSLIGKGCSLVLTTGGTGVALRDVTPEAVRQIAIRELPGFGEQMRMESLKITPNAILSRNLAAVVDPKSALLGTPRAGQGFAFGLQGGFGARHGGRMGVPRRQSAREEGAIGRARPVRSLVAQLGLGGRGGVLLAGQGAAGFREAAPRGLDLDRAKPGQGGEGVSGHDGTI